MWTRAPFGTTTTTIVEDCCFRARSLTLDHHNVEEEEEEGKASDPRFRQHSSNRNSSSNHQELETDTKPSALDYYHLSSQNTSIHHDLLEAASSVMRLPTEEEPRGGISERDETLSHMSTLESPRVGRHQLFQPKSGKLVGCVREESRSQLDDMQTQIVDDHTPASDLEPPEVLSSPSKRRRLVYNEDEEGIASQLKSSEVRSPEQEACDDSGLTAEQHMADLDSSKSSTPEDFDSGEAAPVVSASLTTSEIVLQPQCTSSSPGKEVEQVNVEQVLERRRQFDLHFSSQPQTVVVGDSPRDDDRLSTSQFFSSTGRTWVRQSPHRGSPPGSFTEPEKSIRKTMASGSEGWLQLSLGSRQSDELPQDEPVEEVREAQNPPSSATTAADAPPQPSNLRDFFKFGGSAETEGTPSRQYGSSPYRAQPLASAAAGESSRHYLDNIPESSSHRSGTLPRPLFLEPQPQPRSSSTRDSTWVVDPSSYVHAPRLLAPQPTTTHPTQTPTPTPSGGNAEQFLSPSPILQKGYPQPAFSNLSTLPYHPARVLQPVRSDPTDTTSVHAWRSAGLHYELQTRHQQQQQQQLPWMLGSHDPPRTPPNTAELLSMMPQTAFRDWRSLAGSSSSSGASPPFLSIQPPQSVDPEQAWRNLLQRVGNNLNVPPSFGASGSGSASASGPRLVSDSMMLPPGADREEYLALKRAVERFQGPDQGGKEEQLTELQRLHRNAMFPPQPRYPPSPAFDPSTDISLARLYSSTPSSSGSKQRAPAAPSSDRHRRILRPYAPRAGLWFTLQASNSQPEASPLQQIPTAYIRVVDDNMTVAAVKRYLVNKLGLASEDEVEVTCKGQPLLPSIPLQQVRDGIWQSQNTNTANPNTPQLLSEGKAWKAPDGSITLVGDVVMVLTYGRRPQGPPAST